MATLTIADLDNGKRDLETVDAVANSQADTTTTRYGKQTLTLAGALRRLGWQAPVPYASGLNVDNSTMTVERDSIVYRPDPALVPFTTGAWNPDQWRVVQDTEDPSLVYQFATLAEAQSVAATLPEGAPIIVEGQSSGHVVSGTYVPDRVAPAETWSSYTELDSYSGGAVVGTVTAANVGGSWVRRGTAASNNITVRKDALGRSWEREDSGVLQIQWWGVVADSRSAATSNNIAIQNALNFLATNGGMMRVPRGRYHFNQPLTFSSPTESVGMTNRGSLVGDGSGASVFQWDGVGGEGVFAFKWMGGAQSFQTLEKIGFAGNSTATIGLYLRDLAWARVEDVVCTHFETGFRGENVLSFSAQGMVCRGNRFGAWFLPVNSGAFYAGPNAISLVDCDISLNSEWGLWVQRPGVFSMRGGAIQGNGITGTNPDKWGARFSDAGAEIGVGVNMDGVYLEENVGLADIFIEQYKYSAAHTIKASSVARMANHATHCIRVDNDPVVKTVLNVIGCGFLKTVSYTPSAARKYIYVANPGPSFEGNYDGNFYSSDVELPTIYPSTSSPQKQFVASAVFNGGNGAVVRSTAIASITRIGTGVYDIVFTAPMGSTSYVARAEGVGHLSFGQINNKTVSGFRLVVNNNGGIPTNFSEVSLLVF